MRRCTSELIVVILLKYIIYVAFSTLVYGCEKDVQCDWIEHIIKSQFINQMVSVDQSICFFKGAAELIMACL